MTDKELRRLSRSDLVEIIYEVRKNEAALQEEVDSLKKQLEEKQKKVSKAGNLAELSAGINGLFESAQATADQYLQEISKAYEYARKLQKDTERRATAVANQALRERKELLEQTEEECRRMKEEAAGVRRTVPEMTEGVAAQETTSQRAFQEAASQRVSRGRASQKAPQETAQHRISPKTASHKATQEIQPSRKSARPTMMNDRRKMQ